MIQHDEPTGRSPQPHPTLQPLNVLIGEWRWEAVRAGNERIGQGWARFEWLETGTFLIGHSGSESGDVPASNMVVGLDDSSQQFTQLYADSRGVFRVYQMQFQNGVWELWRDAPGFFQRFKGIFSKDGTSISAYWDVSEDGKTWERDFDLTYKKTTGA